MLFHRRGFSGLARSFVTICFNVSLKQMDALGFLQGFYAIYGSNKHIVKFGHFIKFNQSRKCDQV